MSVSIRKGERLTDAVHRVARNKLGITVEIIEELGAYDHLYDTADVSDAGGKHYVAHGYVVSPDSETFELDDQHEDYRVVDATARSELHPNVTAYLADANSIE